MKQTVIYEISEILDTFDIEEITKLLQNQIESNDVIGTRGVDHFKPLYYKYQSILNTDENSDEIKDQAKSRFMNICKIFLKLISDKYHLDIDDNWLSDNYNNIPGLAMALYSFFVLDVESNIYDVCLNYIKKNQSFIYESFEDRKTKKDAATLINKKMVPQEIAIIISNIYDISSWILSQLSEEQFIEYLNPDYLPLNLISNMLNEGLMNGDFMVELNDIYTSNISLKSSVCFQLIHYLKDDVKNG